MKIACNRVATKASCRFILIGGLFDGTQVYDTNSKCSLDLSEYKKPRFSISKSLPTLFQLSYGTNQLFNVIEGSTDLTSKLETVESLEKQTENATAEVSLAVQFSNTKVFFGRSLNSPLISHMAARQNKVQT